LPAIHVQIPNTLVILAVLVPVVLIAARLGRQPRFAAAFRGLAARLPFAHRLVPQVRTLTSDLRTAATPRRLASGLALTALARLADGLVLLFAAQMMGVPLALPIAIFVVAASGLAGGVSLLPGGAGATEAAMAALLVAVGASFATALSIALLARFCTLWLWVGLGLGEAFTYQLQPVQAR
ncbi:MAG: lysylphosphatidylglycerol synthase domain-containing protein, partial [Rudaea sp.]